MIQLPDNTVFVVYHCYDCNCREEVMPIGLKNYPKCPCCEREMTYHHIYLDMEVGEVKEFVGL